MKLGTRARYAVMAMVDLALNESEKNVTSLQAIATRQELPVAYLEQLFIKLRKANLVQSIRGAQGGYILTRTAITIRIADIIYAVEAPSKTTRCNDHEKKGCHSSGSRCATHDLWEALGVTIHTFFSKITLHDVVSGKIFPSIPANMNDERIGHEVQHVL